MTFIYVVHLETNKKQTKTMTSCVTFFSVRNLCGSAQLLYLWRALPSTHGNPQFGASAVLSTCSFPAYSARCLQHSNATHPSVHASPSHHMALTQTVFGAARPRSIIAPARRPGPSTASPVLRQQRDAQSHSCLIGGRRTARRTRSAGGCRRRRRRWRRAAEATIAMMSCRLLS